MMRSPIRSLPARRSAAPLRGFAGALALAALLPASFAEAQVVRDGTIGAAGPGLVTNAPSPGGGTRFSITEADGEVVGGRNLFHSFSQFDLTEGDEAVYSGSASIQNLITRVTGGPSSIDGVLRSEIDGANLYFVNPQGILFGENASIDVPGSLVFTTAHEIEFADGSRLDTSLAGAPVITVEDVTGFGFLEAPAPIRVLGSSIEGAVDASLSFVGGDLEIRGPGGNEISRIGARSGRIDLVALAGPGSVSLEGARLTTTATERGDLFVGGNATVTTSGRPINAVDFNNVEEGSGPIRILADDFRLEDGVLSTVTVTDEDGGDIEIDLSGTFSAESLVGLIRTGLLTGTGLDVDPPPGSFVTSIFQRPFPTFFAFLDVCGAVVCGAEYVALGAAGDIDIQAQHLRLENGARFTTRSDARGPAGETRLRIAESIRFSGVDVSGERSGLSATASLTGDPGRIRIDSPNATLVMDDFATIVIENSATSATISNPGRIDIDVASIAMSGNARIDSSTRGDGDGGSIDITARDRISLTGRQDALEFTGITSLSQPGSTGDAGDIRIEAPVLELFDGAEIAARPAENGGLGDAGNITLDLSDRLRLDGSTISTRSPAAAGGNIDAFVGNRVDLRDGSSITTEVTSGTAPGGNITIQTDSQGTVVLESSAVLARADLGAGGNILIESSLFLPDPNSTIDASSNADLDGEVVTRAPDGDLLDLSQAPDTGEVEAQELLSGACAARAPGSSSTLVVSGNVALPIHAGRPLSGTLPPAFFARHAPEAIDAEGDFEVAALPRETCAR